MSERLTWSIWVIDINDIRGFLIGDYSEMFNKEADLIAQVSEGLGSPPPPRLFSFRVQQTSAWGEG